MAVVRGIIREVGRSKTTQVSARRWYGSTTIVVQDEKTRKTYTVTVTSKTMDRCRFLPRVGMPVVILGYIEDAEYGLSDYIVSRVTSIKRDLPDHGAKKVHTFDD
jgi:hypothetical protein